MAAKALGIDPRNVAGVNLVKVVTDAYNPATGRYAGDEFSQSLAMIALGVVGEPVPAKASEALLTARLEDGGWGYGGVSEADWTALAVQALLKANAPAGPWRTDALEYFKKNQYADGGWGYFNESNASSTAFVVQALLAMGEDPQGAGWKKGEATPISYLLSQQLPDGSFKGYDPAFATNQVVPALFGLTFAETVEGPKPDGVRPPGAPGPVLFAPLPPSTGTGMGSQAGDGVPLLAAALLLGGASLLLTTRRVRG